MGPNDFTENFEMDAIEYIKKRDHSVAGKSQRFGVKAHHLYRWIKLCDTSSGGTEKDDQL